MIGWPSFRAAAFARRAHGDQQWCGHPYCVHLAMVAEVLWEFGYTAPFWRDAAWLHDTLEDTDTTFGDLVDAFGPAVADAVYRVSGFGSNRDERIADIIKKIITNRKAAVLKTADRIINVEATVAEREPRYVAMYRAERRAFMAAVAPHIPIAMELRLIRAHEGL